MRELRAAITAFAGLDWPLLFLGEPGTGKSAAARSTHDLSNRRDAPYVTFSCAQHDPDRVEALLFGQQQPGATTDGVLSKVGDGTLFLENVETLPNSAQLALIRLLRDGTYQRLGGPDRYRFRGRLLSSSHSADEIPPTLRDDLYFRLSGCLAHSPSLAMRPEDIPEIALHLLQAEAATAHLRITPAVAAQLRGTSWPNNLNDLQPVLAQAAQRVLAKGGDEIAALYDLDERDVQVSAVRLVDQNTDPAVDLKTATEAFQQARVEASLAAAGGNISAAARQLGVTRQWLHRLLTRWAKR
jgi:two-component system NtrC family response regulator